MGFFGKKNKDDGARTALILHIENGSTGSALARLSAERPKLLGQLRIATPVSMAVSGSALSQEIERTSREVLRHAAEVAARMRTHPSTSRLGVVDRAVAVLSPPWGHPDLSAGKPYFLPSVATQVKKTIADSFGDIPVSLYTSAGVAAFGTRAFLTREPCLVCIITGEVTELMRMDEQGVRAHATFPSGVHGLLRTLQTHGGFSLAEARSAARLPFATRHVREPFAAAAEEFGRHFKDAAAALMQPGEVARVVVIGEEPVGEWFAQALALSELSQLFPDGGEVRALRPHHMTGHFSAHAEIPDLPLMLSALFVDNHFNRI